LSLAARSPDGREWEVSVRRVDWPSWPDSSFDPGIWDATVVGMLVAYLVLGPIFWLVPPGADYYD
jgi:hypothetical protein